MQGQALEMSPCFTSSYENNMPQETPTRSKPLLHSGGQSLSPVLLQALVTLSASRAGPLQPQHPGKTRGSQCSFSRERRSDHSMLQSRVVKFGFHRLATSTLFLVASSHLSRKPVLPLSASSFLAARDPLTSVAHATKCISYINHVAESNGDACGAARKSLGGSGSGAVGPFLSSSSSPLSGRTSCGKCCELCHVSHESHMTMCF